MGVNIRGLLKCSLFGAFLTQWYWVTGNIRQHLEKRIPVVNHTVLDITLKKDYKVSNMVREYLKIDKSPYIEAYANQYSDPFHFRRVYVTYHHHLEKWPILAAALSLPVLGGSYTRLRGVLSGDIAILPISFCLFNLSPLLLPKTSKNCNGENKKLEVIRSNREVRIKGDDLLQGSQCSDPRKMNWAGRRWLTNNQSGQAAV